MMEVGFLTRFFKSGSEENWRIDELTIALLVMRLVSNLNLIFGM